MFLHFTIIPNAKQSRLKEEGGTLTLYLKSPPENNRANLELIQFFKKEYGFRVRIVRGMKSREKVVEILR